MTKPCAEKILVVDDAVDTLEVIRRNLMHVGHQVWTATSVQEAVKTLETKPFDIVITDFRMPKTSGLDLVRHVRENYKHMEIVMITGYASIPGAVTAMQTGAHEYLAKPFTDAELLDVVHRAAERIRRRTPFDAPVATSDHNWGLLGSSPAMQAVFRSIQKAAQSSATVLILGESGTGKELVARAIHYSSKRRAAAFVPVNCGGIPEGLLESELFGARKGAFTGAHESRAGFFQTADGGSIFLDEIAELSMTMQTVLLRVLQDKAVFMVGSRQPSKVDVRIIAATNKDVENLVSKGALREDLYYRINVIPITIPPLRERGEDIPLLIRHFSARYATELDKPAPQFTDRVLHNLQNYPWPGNVRELENVIQRLVLMAEGDSIDAADLPELMRFSAIQPESGLRSLADVQAEHICNVLNAVGGNKSQAARILGIDRKTLRDKFRSANA